MTSTPTRAAGTRPSVPDGPAPFALGTLGRRAAAALSFRNIGAVYVWLVIVVVFSIWAPETFPTMTTVRQILNGNAVAGLVALSVVPPLAARVFDLSVAYTMSLTSVLTARFLVSAGIGPGSAIALAMTAALLVGVVNGIVVVLLRVDSFIATHAPDFVPPHASGGVESCFRLDEFWHRHGRGEIVPNEVAVLIRNWRK